MGALNMNVPSKVSLQSFNLTGAPVLVFVLVVSWDTASSWAAGLAATIVAAASERMIEVSCIFS